MSRLRPTALFLLEASPSVGYGHAARCLALAEIMSRSWSVSMVVNRSAAEMLPETVQVMAVFPDGRPEEGVAALIGRPRLDAELVVVDHYDIDTRLESALKAHVRRLLVLDDLANRVHEADILLDSMPARHAKDYADLVSPQTRLLLGSDYALLRPEFRTARLQKENCVRKSSKYQRILVSLGATDPGNATARVLSALTMAGAPISATVVLGSAAPHLEAVRGMLGTLSYPAELVVDARNMGQLYASHDFAIGAPATSALERACVGLPSILIETADNQRALGEELGRSGAAQWLGREAGPQCIAAAVEGLMCEQSRASLRAAGQALIDGLGTRRVAAMLLYDLQTRDGRPLLGRRLLSEDAGTILNWQRAPGARRYSRNPLVPGDREHNDWMNSRLSSLNTITEILTLEGKPVAMARLDPDEGGYEVSILVAPEEQGRGVGEAALRYLDVLCGEEAATAYVHPDNAPSLRLFRRCGYGSVHGRDLVLLADNSRDGAAIQ